MADFEPYSDEVCAEAIKSFQERLVEADNLMKDSNGMMNYETWSDWQVRLIAQNMAEKRPKRDWFDGEDENYLTSLKSWSHITARQLYSMEL